MDVKPPPPLPGWAEFTIMIECSSESDHCQSTCTLSSVGGTMGGGGTERKLDEEREEKKEGDGRHVWHEEDRRKGL